MVGTKIGTSISVRTASDQRVPMRQQPMAHSVPATSDRRAAATAITKLCPMLESHASLVKRLAKCCSDMWSCGSDR